MKGRICWICDQVPGSQSTRGGDRGTADRRPSLADKRCNMGIPGDECVTGDPTRYDRERVLNDEESNVIAMDFAKLETVGWKFFQQDYSSLECNAAVTGWDRLPTRRRTGGASALRRHVDGGGTGSPRKDGLFLGNGGEVPKRGVRKNEGDPSVGNRRLRIQPVPLSLLE